MSASPSGQFESQLVQSSAFAYRAALAVLHNAADAEDVTQEALLAAHRSFHQLREPDRCHSWVARISWRLALNKLRSERSKSRREQDCLVLYERSETAIDAMIRRERCQHLWNAINRLPARLREVIMLAGMEEYSTREVAGLLNLPEGTVRSRLFHARHKLRKMLAEV